MFINQYLINKPTAEVPVTMIIESVEEPIKNATVNESCEELDAGILGKQVEFTRFIFNSWKSPTEA